MQLRMPGLLGSGRPRGIGRNPGPGLALSGLAWSCRAWWGQGSRGGGPGGWTGFGEGVSHLGFLKMIYSTPEL